MSVSENLLKIEQRIQAACKRAARDRSGVTLIAVSKFQSNELIEEAYECGVRDFGENYVQALAERREHFRAFEDIRWHLIGHLQSNKAKAAVSSAHVFQALDSEKLLGVICKAVEAHGLGEPWPVFVEVNIDEEPSKSGVRPQEAAALVQKVRAAHKSIFLRGLFCVPKADVTEEETRQAFRRMRALRDQIDPKLELSMGMSSDFETAIEEGADLVRIGTKIFGERAKR